MIFEMLRWWYVSGWLQAARRIVTLSRMTSRAFSMPMLARTLFSPWRRIVTLPGRSMDARLRAWFDNLISRFVGFGVRTIVLLMAVIAVGGTAVISTVLAIAWPILPIAFLYALARSIIG